MDRRAMMDRRIQSRSIVQGVRSGALVDYRRQRIVQKLRSMVGPLDAVVMLQRRITDRASCVSRRQTDLRHC